MRILSVCLSFSLILHVSANGCTCHQTFYRASACRACRARYCFINSVSLSVCLSVYLSVQCRHCVLTNWLIVTRFWHSGRDIILNFCVLPPLQNSRENPFSRGVKYTEGGEFFCNIALYLENGTRKASYYGTLIGSHRWPIDPYRFQWPWVTLKGGAWSAKKFPADIHN